MLLAYLKLPLKSRYSLAKNQHYLAMARTLQFSTGTSAGITYLDATTGSKIYRERGLPQWTLNYTLEGCGTFNGQNGSFLSYPGDLVLIQPGVLNDYGHEPVQQKWTHLWAVFTPTPGSIEALGWEQALPGIRRTRVEDPSLREAVEQQFQLLIRFFQTPIGEQHPGCLEMLECILCLAKQTKGALARPVDERIKATLAFACQHLGADLSLPVLAQQAHLSVSRFAHLFAAQMGQTPMQYVEHQRLRRAAELLLMSNYSVGRVSEEVGFRDPVHFARVFRRARGVSPRAFRKRLPR